MPTYPGSPTKPGKVYISGESRDHGSTYFIYFYSSQKQRWYAFNIVCDSVSHFSSKPQIDYKKTKF